MTGKNKQTDQSKLRPAEIIDENGKGTGISAVGHDWNDELVDRIWLARMRKRQKPKQKTNG